MHKRHPILQAIPLCLVLFIDGIGLGLLFPIFSVLFLDHHVAFLQANTSDHIRTMLFGVSAGVFMLCWFFGASIIGDLSDSLGRKKSMAICLLGAGLGYGLTAIAIDIHSVGLIILGRVIAGFTAGSQPVAQAAMVDIAPENKTAQYINYVLLALSLGFMFGPLLGGVLSNAHLVHWFTLATPLWFACIVSLANIVLLFTLYQEASFPRRKLAINLLRPITLFIEAFTFKAIRSLSVVYLCFQLAWASIYSFLAIYGIKHFAMGVSETSYLMTCMGLGFAIGMSGFIQWLMQKLSMKNMVAVNWFIGSALTAGIVLSPQVWMLWPIMICLGASLGASYGNIVALFSKQVSEDKQGWVMGITGAVGALAFGVIEFSASTLLSFGYATPIWIGSGLIILAAIGLIGIKVK